MYNVRHEFAQSETYQYDLVDLTRQVLGDYAKYLHKQAVNAFYRNDLKGFQTYSSKFLALIRDEDKLLSTRKEFNVGTWINQARNAACTPQEQERFVANAKRQITTWTNHDSKLHDYALKEWSGLMRDMYLPRWEAWVDYKLALLRGETAQEPDYFQIEKNWVGSDTRYDSTSTGNAISAVEEIYKKYFIELQQTYKNI